MKERPIIFTSEMVRAILKGIKTQTRRVIKPQPEITIRKIDDVCSEVIWKDKDRCLNAGGGGNVLQWVIEHEIKCPYGQPGDRLWVRERYSISGNGVFYKTDTDGTVHIAWIPAIFMPRKYSRITLEITNIRVEKLCKISIEDANAEGFLPTNECLESMVFGFSQYWDSLNGKKYPWLSNPWVWVINFYIINKGDKL